MEVSCDTGQCTESPKDGISAVECIVYWTQKIAYFEFAFTVN